MEYYLDSHKDRMKKRKEKSKPDPTSTTHGSGRSIKESRKERKRSRMQPELIQIIMKQGYIRSQFGSDSKEEARTQQLNTLRGNQVQVGRRRKKNRVIRWLACMNITREKKKRNWVRLVLGYDKQSRLLVIVDSFFPDSSSPTTQRNNQLSRLFI